MNTPQNTTPHCLEAEQSVLGALIIDNESLDKISALIREQDFLIKDHALIFRSIIKLAAMSKPFDVLTLSEELRETNVDLAYLATIAKDTPSSANIVAYADIVIEKAQRRAILKAAQRIAERAIDSDYNTAQLLSESRTYFSHLLEQSQKSQTCFQWADDFCALPTTEMWSIEDYLEPDTLCVMYGDSESYKSFLAIDITCHIATAKSWRGKNVTPGMALYIAGEGGNGLKKRIKAWFDYHGEPIRNMAISLIPREICNPANVADLVVHIKEFLKEMALKPSLIVLDTLNTHFGNGDENNTADMTKFITGLRTLRIETGAAILISHHCGHSAKDRSRGSIALHNAIDWEYQLERNQNSQTTTLKCTKCKDHQKPESLSWNLEIVPLPWVDDKWRPINSAVLVPNDSVPATQPVQDKLRGQQREALELLEELYRKQHENAATARTARVAVSDWANAMKSINADSSYRTKLRKWLAEHGYVRIEGQFAYLPTF